MIADSERREVARRLRELHLGGGSKDLIELTLSDAIGAWRKSGMSWDFITERLADLIEPEPERTCRMVDCSTHDTCVVNRELCNGNVMSMEFGYKQCSECGAYVFDCPTVRYCPSCGAKVVSDARD